MANKAVFLDRDGTVIEDPGYLCDPAKVTLLPGVDLAIKSLRQAGFRIVVVTNQSGIARGVLTEETLETIHAELRRRLAEKGAMLDAIYYCPFHPDGALPTYAKESDLRKPAPGMLHKAAEELDIDLADSWMVGNADRDVAAGRAAGCRTVRIRSRNADAPPAGRADLYVRNLVDAARVILRAEAQHAEEPAAESPAALSQLDSDPPADEPEPTKEPPPTPAPEEAPSAPPEEDSLVRKEILRHVRQISKQAETVEFNVANLLGGVAQVLVVLFLLLVFWVALGKQEYDSALLWAVVAGVLQTMSLTFFIMARSQK